MIESCAPTMSCMSCLQRQAFMILTYGVVKTPYSPIPTYIIAVAGSSTRKPINIQRHYSQHPFLLDLNNAYHSVGCLPSLYRSFSRILQPSVECFATVPTNYSGSGQAPSSRPRLPLPPHRSTPLSNRKTSC